MAKYYSTTITASFKHYIKNRKRTKAHQDTQYEKAITVENDRTKCRSRCLTAWLASEGKIIGSNDLKKNS